MTIAVGTLSIDSYLRSPNLTFTGMLALARALAEAAPVKMPPHVKASKDRLDEAIVSAEKALVVRQRHTPVDPGADAAVDALADGLWAVLRDRLASWQVFENATLAELAGAKKGTAISADVTRARKNAARARELLERLFGSDGLSFLRTPYAEQAEHSAALLRLIDEDGLASALAEVVGPEVLSGLRLAQRAYESMVHARAAMVSEGSDLGRLRTRLQRVVVAYATSWVATADEDAPDTLDAVATALRPMETARAAAAQRARPPADDQDQDTDPTEPDPTPAAPVATTK